MKIFQSNYLPSPVQGNCRGGSDTSIRLKEDTSGGEMQRGYQLGEPFPHLEFSSLPLTSTSLHATTTLGIVGGGTVGGGIVSILTSNAPLFTTMTGKDLLITRLAVRDTSKSRDFITPEGCKVTDDFNDVINDPSVDTIVEVMGGTTLAKDCVFRALKNGKNVVTANKALIAAYLPEIESLVKSVNEDRNEGTKPVEFRYEAAVCGGIPIISSMQGDYVGDEVEMISGIINGCTNYMLTSMDRDGLSYDER